MGGSRYFPTLACVDRYPWLPCSWQRKRDFQRTNHTQRVCSSIFTRSQIITAWCTSRQRSLNWSKYSARGIPSWLLARILVSNTCVPSSRPADQRCQGAGRSIGSLTLLQANTLNCARLQPLTGCTLFFLEHPSSKANTSCSRHFGGKLLPVHMHMKVWGLQQEMLLAFINSSRRQSVSNLKPYGCASLDFDSYVCHHRYCADNPAGLNS